MGPCGYLSGILSGDDMEGALAPSERLGYPAIGDFLLRLILPWNPPFENLSLGPCIWMDFDIKPKRLEHMEFLIIFFAFCQIGLAAG